MCSATDRCLLAHWRGLRYECGLLRGDGSSSGEAGESGKR